MPIVVETTGTPLGDGLTGEDILDAAISHIQDKSATMRSLLTRWLNSFYQKAHTERDWLFLQQTYSGTIADNQIVKPSNFGRLVYAKGSDFFLEPKHRLTGREAYEFTDENTADPTPLGFEETATAINFLPGASGDVSLRYIRLIPAAADSDTATVWPWRFLPMFERSLLSAYYEYDGDQRGMPSLTLDRAELDLLKFADNMQKPIPKQSRKGFLRGR